MRTSSNHLTATTRLTGACALSVWLIALVLCWFHCSFGSCESGGRPGVKHASCHGSPISKGQKSLPPSNGSSCLAKNQFSSEQSTLSVQAPEQVLSYDLPLLADLLLSQLDRSDFSRNLRESSQPHFVFEPEVCLGPAFRSLAPPPLFT